MTDIELEHHQQLLKALKSTDFCYEGGKPIAYPKIDGRIMRVDISDLLKENEGEIKHRDGEAERMLGLWEKSLRLHGETINGKPFPKPFVEQNGIARELEAYQEMLLRKLKKLGEIKTKWRTEKGLLNSKEYSKTEIDLKQVKEDI